MSRPFRCGRYRQNRSFEPTEWETLWVDNRVFWLSIELWFQFDKFQDRDLNSLQGLIQLPRGRNLSSTSAADTGQQLDARVEEEIASFLESRARNFAQRHTFFPPTADHES